MGGGRVTPLSWLRPPIFHQEDVRERKRSRSPPLVPWWQPNARSNFADMLVLVKMQSVAGLISFFSIYGHSRLTLILEACLLLDNNNYKNCLLLIF